MFCKYCGSEVSERARFCPDCGKRLEKIVVLKETAEENNASSWAHEFNEEDATPVTATPVASASATEPEAAPSAPQPPSAVPYASSTYPPTPPPNETYYTKQPAPNPYFYAPPKKDRSGCAIAALVLGLMSVVFFTMPLFGFPVSLIGIIMGALGRNSQYRGMSIAGLVLSIIFLIFTLGMIALTILFVTGASSGFSYHFY